MLSRTSLRGRKDEKREQDPVKDKNVSDRCISELVRGDRKLKSKRFVSPNHRLMKVLLNEIWLLAI